MKGAAFLLFLSLAAISVTGAAAASAADVVFIQASCRRSGYPSLCTRTLTPFAAAVRRNPRKLAKVSIYVALGYATSSSSFLHAQPAVKPSAGALFDCLQTIDNGLDLLKKSAAEMRLMGRPGTPDFSWHLSNVQTWLSGAMSEASTCIDGVAGSSIDRTVKVAVSGKILSLKQRTSVALFFVYRI